MTLKTQSEGRQSPLIARAAFTAADLPGTDFAPALQLPSDAVILRGYLAITTAFGAGTTVSVGTAADDDAYLAATAADATGVTALTGGITGAVVADVTMMGLTASAAMADGEGALVVEYIRSSRAQVTEG